MTQRINHDTIPEPSNEKEYVVDFTHIRPFYYDPAYVTPHNIAVKVTKKWLVRWLTDPPSETWGTYENLEMLRHSNITVSLTGSIHFLGNSPLSSLPRFLTCSGGQRQDSSPSRPLNRRQYERHVTKSQRTSSPLTWQTKEGDTQPEDA